MTARKIVKTTVNILTALGAYGITREIIDNNTAEPESRFQAATHYAGSAAIAGVVTDVASDHTGKAVDEIFDIIERRKTPTT